MDNDVKNGWHNILIGEVVYLSYYINNERVCRTWVIHNSNGDGYKGQIYRCNHSASNKDKPYTSIVSDEDLDVLKLKCLVKAKEMGWNVKGIKI